MTLMLCCSDNIIKTLEMLRHRCNGLLLFCHKLSTLDNFLLHLSLVGHDLQLAHIRIFVNVRSPQPPLLTRIANLKSLSRMQHPPIVEDDAFSGLHHPLINDLWPMDKIVELLGRSMPRLDSIVQKSFRGTMLMAQLAGHAERALKWGAPSDMFDKVHWREVRQSSRTLRFVLRVLGKVFEGRFTHTFWCLFDHRSSLLVIVVRVVVMVCDWEPTQGRKVGKITLGNVVDGLVAVTEQTGSTSCR